MNITADGTYPLTPQNNRFSAGTIYINGALGTATATINYSNNGTLTPLSDGLLAINDEYNISHGQLAVLVLVVATANGATDFDINYHGIS